MTKESSKWSSKQGFILVRFGFVYLICNLCDFQAGCDMMLDHDELLVGF